MGYAGYVPAKLPPSKLSPLQAALKQIQSVDTLEILGKLVRNVVINPTEEKYKKIRLTNAKIQSSIVEVPGALDALLAMGWAYDPEDQSNLVVPKGVKLSMAEVREIEDTKQSLRKELSRNMSRSSSAASIKNEELKAQIEADKLERAAREPVSQDSKAQQLGAGAIKTASDAGLTSGGCC